MQGSPADLAKSGVDYAQLVGTKENADDENSETGSRQLSRTPSITSTSSNSTTKSSEPDKNRTPEVDEGVQLEESSKGKVKNVSANYFLAGAHWTVLFFLVCLFLIVQVLASGADYWVSVW